MRMGRIRYTVYILSLARDIICSTMNHRTLGKLRRELAQLRRPLRPHSPRTLESLAQRLGRVMEGGGSHPLWVSQRFPELRAVPIPHHSVDIKPRTARSILDQLEEDI